MTSPARIYPITGGTNDVEPGTERRPGAFGSVGCNFGARGGSVEYTTRTSARPRFLHCVRITRASGSTEVL